MTVESGAERPTGFVYDDRFLLHQTGPGHPESPKRLEAILRRLRTAPVWNSLRTVTPEPADLDTVKLVHRKDYVDYVERACSRGVRILDGGDTVISDASFSVALLAAGGIVRGVKMLFEDSVHNVFCAIRPPGHHAESAAAMGFCLFNNAAIGARYAQQAYQIERVLILDWDVHHGNGTQHIFESDPSVFYVSVHQFPFYPGSGNDTETGTRDGLGTTRNFPLPAGKGDREYLHIIENELPHIAEKFSPELIIVSSGFDAHEQDPMAGMRVSTDVFGRMTETVRRIASEWCGGRLLSILEGGYNIEALQDCVEMHLSTLVSDR